MSFNLFESREQQAFDTQIPVVAYGRTLSETVAALPLAGSSARLVLDNYESSAPLGKCHLMGDTSVALAIGPERGWSARDRETLRSQGFVFAHLGARVLRTETACIAALTLVRAKLGLM